MATAFPPIHTGFSWILPTTNVDGSPLAPGELTGILVGVRVDGDTAHGPGNYSTVATAGPAATGETLVAGFSTLSPGNYWVAVQSQSATNGNSVWSAEVPFAILPKPNAPSGLAAT